MAYRDREVKSGGGFGSVLLFLSGVACGMLFATQPGKETREQLIDWWNKGREKSREMLERGKEEMSKQKEALSSSENKEPFYESGKYT